MELSQLTAFYHTARLGNVSRAAEVVYRTQPAVSQQIKALEQELGCHLFARLGKRKLVLTAQGERLFQFVAVLLPHLEQTVSEIHAMCGENRGRLRITAPFTTCLHLLPAILEQFTAEFPHVHVTLTDCPQHAGVALVREGEADVAVCSESAVPRGLRSIRWKHVTPVLLVPKGHPLQGRRQVGIAEIAAQRLILPAHHPGRSRLEEAARKAGLALNVVLQCSSVEMSALLVERGLGVTVATIVDDFSIAQYRALEAVSLDHILPDGYLAVATRDEAPGEDIRELFVSMLLAHRGDTGREI